MRHQTRSASLDRNANDPLNLDDSLMILFGKPRPPRAGVVELFLYCDSHGRQIWQLSHDDTEQPLNCLLLL